MAQSDWKAFISQSELAWFKLNFVQIERGGIDLKAGVGNIDPGGPLPAEFSSNPGKKNLTASWRPWLAASGVFD